MTYIHHDPSTCACFNLRKATRVITRKYDKRLRAFGITTPQFTILTVLDELQPAQVNGLAEALAMDRTTLSRNLDRMEEQGLVESRPGEEDARTRVIELTPEGDRTLEEAFPEWQKAQKSVVESMGSGSFEALIELLQRVNDLVDN